MRPYYLRDILTYKDATSKELQSMIDTTNERSVELPDGTRGFIIGATVIAPFYFTETCIAQKDGKDIVLTYQALHPMGVTILKLPFNIALEPLSFRRTKIHKDTFLFRVFDEITLSRGFSMHRYDGHLEVSPPDGFCPVYDRFGHLIGMNVGAFNDERICIPIFDLL